MTMTRSHAVAAAVAAAAALTATGITYATAAPAPQAQPQAQVAPAVIPAQAPMGGEGGKGNEGNEHGGNEHEGNKHEGKRHHKEGRIFINEREFSARSRGCMVVVSGLGSTSFNIRNESRDRLEFFRGVTCDNGAPIATVGPRSEANNVRPGKLNDEDEDCEKGEHNKGEHHERMQDGVRVKNGVVGSFRVIKRHHDEKGDGGDFDEGDGGDY